MVLAGRVTINGKRCEIGDQADPIQDQILVDGKPLPEVSRPVYIMLHKPRGYVTTLSDEKGRKTVAELVSDCGTRVYPCGRLDMDSEGLLILTNDGAFANSLMHPKHQVDKVYSVSVSGYTEEGLQKLKIPVVLDGYMIAKPRVELIRKGKTTLLEVTIHEGRNRQVRRMCELAGMKVQRLKRIQEGSIRLGDLPCGKWRYLTDEEISQL